MKGKLIKFEKHIVNNVHASFEGKNGKLYKFNVYFDVDGNEVKGVANSTKQEPSWVIGNEYTFDLTSNTSSYGTKYSNISNIKKVDTPNLHDSKSFLYQKLFEGCLESVYKFYELNPDIQFTDDNQDIMLNKIFNFVNNGETDDKKWILLSSIRLTIQKMHVPNAVPKGVKISSWFFETATNIAEAMELTVNKYK